ncbi:hypothetical protein T492DRAFT_917566, partial [Pavlovales sp. CCMP2436]
KDAAKALREQKKQKEAAKLAELESKCRTIAEFGRVCGKESYALQRVGPWQRSAPSTAAPAAE